MNQPKVSIIIPVYNTEDYVQDALSSIMNQSLKEIQIIVINDGSTDTSLQKVCTLAEQDTRIQVFSQSNKGLSEARNAGLSQSLGQYVYFMDSDDLLEKDTLLSCYEKCEKEHLDFVFFDAESFSDDGQHLDPYYDYTRAKLVEDRIYQGTEILRILLDKGVYKASVCLNLINRDFLHSIDLKFYPGIIHEDELFTGLQYISAKRVGCIPKAFFKRRVRVNSIMTSTYSFRHINGYLCAVSQIREHAKQQHDRTVSETSRELIRYILNPSVYNAHVLSLPERMKVIGICLQKSYFKYLTLKNSIVLLFPFTIAVKSVFKKALFQRKA